MSELSTLHSREQQLMSAFANVDLNVDLHPDDDSSEDLILSLADLGLYAKPPAPFSESEYRGLFWFSTLEPSWSPVFVGSSRLGKQLDQYPEWFDALRTLARRLRQEIANPCFVTAKSTTCHRFVKRIGELFRIPVVEFRRVSKSNVAGRLKITSQAHSTYHVCLYKLSAQHSLAPPDYLLSTNCPPGFFSVG